MIVKQGIHLLAVLSFLYTVVPGLKACLICEDTLTPEENALEKMVQEKGSDAVPALREVLRCPANPGVGLKVIAARELGRLHDKESIGLLDRIISELSAPGSDSDFGVFTPSHALRVAAADSLTLMDAGGRWKNLWMNWRELPPLRQEEIPALLYHLGAPDLQEKQLEMLRTSGNRSVELQVIVELRRSGDNRAIPDVETKIAEWKKLSEEEGVRGIKRSDLPKMIRYAEGTVRALQRR